MTRILALAVCLAALAAAPASADTTFTVTKTADVDDGACMPGNCSLRDAVKAANATAGVDTIDLPAGQFTLTGAAGDNTNAGGDLDLTESLNVVGAGAAATTIDSNDIDRAFDVFGATSALSLTGLTITRGLDPNGAVVQTQGPGLSLTGVLLKDNAAGGGGVSGFGLLRPTTSGAFALSIDHTTFDSNSSGGGGGSGFGLMDIGTGNGTTVTFTDSTFTSNHVGGGNNGSGFGLIDFLAGATGSGITITRSVFRNNTVGGGGMNASGFGIVDSLAGTLDITDSTFSGNNVGGGFPGAAGFGTIVSNAGDVHISGSTFSGNQVGGGDATATGFGAALDHPSSSPATIENSTFAGNTAGGGGSGGFGGAVTVGSGPLTITNSTFVGNSAAGASNGGALNTSSATVIAANTVFSGNTAAGVANSCSAPVTTSSGGNVDDTSSCGFSAPADFIGNARLGTLGDYGGLTPTVPPLPGSPAINHGVGCSAADQRGFPRPFGGACDSGAYEFAPPAPSTGGATSLKTTSAVLGGSVVPNLRPASVHFEFGKTTSYGSQSAPQTASGVASEKVSATISGLKPGTTYHFRLVASGDDTVFGKDATFKTPSVSLSKLRLSPTKFRAAPRGGSIARKRKTGTNVSYTASEASKTTFKVLKPAAGRRQGKSCRKPSARNRHGRKCTRLVSLGNFSHNDKAGQNKLHFTGRVHHHKLKPGKYRLRATPRAQGVSGKARTVRFKIVR